MAKALNIDLNVNANTSLARQELSLLQNTLKQLTTASGEISKNLTTGMDLSKTIAQVTELRALLQSATNVDTGVLNFTKLNQSILSANTSLAEYGKTLNSLGPSGQRAFLLLATAVSKSEIPIGQANGMLKQFGTTMKNTLRWQASSMLLHGAMNSILKAWNYAQKLDRSLTDIQIVTKQSDALMARFAEHANKAARALSTSTTAYTDAALIYYQQGLGDKAVRDRTDVTVKMANVTGRSAEKVSNQMTAIWNNFDNGSKSLEYYADVITALGAATASSSDEIATGLSKFAAVADTVGLSYENATAALATITATTRQSADSVGNGLKTLFSRLQSLSLGKTLEDGVNLTKYTKALNTVGVSALDAAGNLRSMDSILADLGERWGTLSSAQLNALAQTVGGVRLYVTFTALMDNYDFFKDNIQIAKSAAGELLKQADIYDQSWAAARKHVQASAEAIYSDLIDDKFFTSLTNGFAGLLHLVDNFIDGIGGIKGVLLSAGAAFANFNKLGMQSFFLNTINGILTFLPGGAEKLLIKRNETLNQFLDMLLHPTITNAKGEDIEVGFTSLESRYRAEGIARNLRLQLDYLEKAPHMTEALRLAALMYMDNIATRGEEVAGLAAKVDRSLIARDDAQMAFRGFKNNKIPIKKVPTGQSRNQFVSDQMGQILSTNESYQKLIGNTKDSFVKFEADLKAFGIKSVLSGDALSQQAKALETLLANPNYKLYAQDLTILKDLATGKDVKGYNALMQNLFADKINVMREDAIDQVLQDMKDRGLFKGGTKEQQEARRAEAETSLRNVYKTTAQLLEDEARLRNTNGELGDLRTVTLPAMLQQLFGTALGLTEVSGMLMNFGMGLSTLKGALSTLKNDDISAGDKAISLMTSVGFGLPMILKGAKDFADSGIVKALGEQGLNKSATSALGESIKSYKTLENGSRLYTGVTGRTATIAAKEIPSDKAILNIGLSKAGGYAALVAAAIAAGVVIERSIVTANERLDDLNQGLEWSKIRADEAKESYSDLLSGFDNHNKALLQLNDLSVGTLEYRQKLLETNAATQELIDQYNISEDLYTIDHNGVISINATEQDKIAKEQLKKAELALTKYEVEKGMVAALLAYADYQNFVKDYRVASGQGNGYGKSLSVALSYATGAFREYGYASGEELILAYENGELYNKIFEGLNVASPIAMGIRDSLNDKFPNGLNDILNTLIDSIASDSEFLQQLLDENKINTRGIWAVPNSIKALSDRYAAQFGQAALEELQSSDEYKNATRAQRRDMLAREMENDEINKANLEQFNKIWNLLSSPGTNAINALSSWTALNYTDFTNVITNLTQSANTLEEDSALILKDFYGNVTEEYGEIVSNFTSTFGLDSLKLGYSAAQMKDMNLQVKSYANEFGVETRSFLISLLIGTGGDSLLSNLKKIELSGNVIADMFNIKESGTILGKDLSAKLIETMKTDLGGDSGLFAELFSDSEFSSAFSDLKEIFDSGKGIKASDIADLVDSIPTLNKYLKLTNINTLGIADTLEFLASGRTTIDLISSSFLNAVSIAGGLESATEGAFAWMDSYKEGPDVEDIDSDLLKMEKAIYSNIKLGLYANGPVQSAIEHLFGKDVLNQWLYDFSEGSKQSGVDLTTYMKNTDIYKRYIDPLMDMYKAGDVTPFYRELLNSLTETNNLLGANGENINLNDIMSVGTNGWGLEITNDDLFLKNFKTFSEFANYIAQTDYGKNLTPDMIDMLVSLYAGTYGANGYLRRLWQINEGIAGLGAFTGTTYTQDTNRDGEIDKEEEGLEKLWVYARPNEYSTEEQVKEFLNNLDLTHLSQLQVIDLLTTSNFAAYDLNNDPNKLFTKESDGTWSVNTDNFAKILAKVNNNIVSLGENPQEVTSDLLENIYNANNGNTWDLLWQQQAETFTFVLTKERAYPILSLDYKTPQELFENNEDYRKAMGVTQWDENGQPILPFKTQRKMYENYLKNHHYDNIDEYGNIGILSTKTGHYTEIQEEQRSTVDLDKALEIMEALGRGATALDDIQKNYKYGDTENGIGYLTRTYFDINSGRVQTAMIQEGLSVQEFYDLTGGSKEQLQQMMELYDAAIEKYNADVWYHIISGDKKLDDNGNVIGEWTTKDLKETSTEQMEKYLAEIAESTASTAETNASIVGNTELIQTNAGADAENQYKNPKEEGPAEAYTDTGTGEKSDTNGQSTDISKIKIEASTGGGGSQSGIPSFNPPAEDKDEEPAEAELYLVPLPGGGTAVMNPEQYQNWLQKQQETTVAKPPSGGTTRASGLNNHIPGFASGYQGPATVGELGPETWVHDGQMDIVGLNGRETIWVNPSDTILTAGLTNRLLDGHKPGFSGGWIHNGSGGGSRRGSGSGSDKDDDEKWKDSWEPYHEISREVQRLTTDVENLNTEMERAFGVEKIQKMEEELDLLDLRLLQESDYIAEAEAYIAEYEQYLPDGTEVVDGVILNYDELLEKYLKDIYQAQEDRDKDKLEKLQREWQKIQTYEQHTDKLEERRQEQLNLLYQKADLMLQELLYSIDQVNNSLDESESLIDYMLNHMNTDMFKMAESIALVGDATDITIQKMELAKQSIQDYEDMLGTEYANDEELVNNILQERNNLLKLNQELDKQRDNVIKKLTYAIQEFNNELKKATKLLTNYNTLIKNYTDLSELMGLSTINNTEQIDKLNDALKNNMGLNIQATKSQLETNQALIAQMEADFANDRTGRLREEYDDVYQKLIEEGQGLSVTLSNNLQSMLNFIVKEFETELDRALTSFQDQITKGFGTWDELTSAANSLKGAQDVNTKAYDRVYQLNTLIRDMDSYMNDMTSAKNHNSILKFQELIKKLKADNTDLSQEELDVLRAQFELMLAQFDLEDAQNAKNQVRLQRDMNGNWGYVYTADEDAMAEAQLNVDDKLKAYLDAVTALQQVQGEYMGTVAELEIQEQELRNELNQLGHTDEDEERRALLLKQIAAIEEQLSMYKNNLLRMQDTLNEAVDSGHGYIQEIWDESNELFNASLGALPQMMLESIATTEEFFDVLSNAEIAFVDRTTAAKDAYMEQYEEWAPYLEQFNNGLGDMAEQSLKAVTNLDALNELYLQEFTEAMEAAVKWEQEYGQQMETIIKLNLDFIDSLDRMIDGLRDLDSMDYSVSFRRVTNNSEVSAMTSMDSGGYTGAWGTSGKIAMLHEKEQVFNAQDTLNLLTAALILRTIDASANSMAIGLNNMITPKIDGVAQQIDLTVSISASFPNVVNHLEIEEAFNNLTNKAMQYANRKNA